MEALRVYRRRSLADHNFENFRRYYEEKNLPKALEFLWGALNALPYALGLLYGTKGVLVVS
jgi:hypothetical protein